MLIYGNYKLTLGQTVQQNKSTEKLVDFGKAEDGVYYARLTGPTLGRYPSANNRKLSNSLIRDNDFDFYREMQGRIIWLPHDIDAGFIIQDEEHDLELWNTSYVGQTVTALVYDPDNTGINIFTPTIPFTIGAKGSELLTVTFYEDGPPEQDTIATFTINGVAVPVELTGTRVVPVPYEPNWDDGPKIEYIFETVVTATERFREQRRPLVELPRRSTEVSIYGLSQRAQYFWNSLNYGKDKVFGVPIWNEVFFVQNATAGDTTINTVGSVEKFWNLQNFCEYVMFYDIDTYAYEVRGLDSASNTSIDLVSELLNTFDVDKTVVFPIFLAYVESMKLDPNSFSYHKGTVKFTEL